MKLNRAFYFLILALFVMFSALKATADNVSNFDIDNKNFNSCKNLEMAQVKYIADGDTVHLYTGGEIIKTRLYGIDCMETSKIHRAYRQAYESKLDINEVMKQGNKATKELKSILKLSNNKVYFKTMAIDSYGRLVAILYDKDLSNINDKMLETGYCPAYKFKQNKTNSYRTKN